MEEFYNICKQVTKDTDNDGIIDQYGCTGYTWQQAVAAYDGDLFNEAGTKAYFDSEEVKNALLMINKLKTLSGNYEVTSQDFDEGKVAFLPMTLAEYRTYQPILIMLRNTQHFHGFVSLCHQVLQLRI